MKTRPEYTGTFVLSGVPDGPVVLRVLSEWHTDGETPVEGSAGDEVVLRVDRRAILEARVVDREGRPQGNVTVTVAGEGDRYETSTGGNGHLCGYWNRDFMALRAGTYRVTPYAIP